MKKSKKKEKKQEAPKKPSRPMTPPHKSSDYDGWLKWYREEINERLSKGQTLRQIEEELKVNPKRFIE